MARNSLCCRWFGQVPYRQAWQAMQSFTATRAPTTEDECWLLEHPPVYTLGRAGRLAHVRDTCGIEVVHTDRGGQVTYHGPGQLVAYVLFDLARAGLSVRETVTQLECVVIDLLSHYGISACARREAPGVYVQDAKIASLGLRVKRGCSYHGLAINVSNDLAYFEGIDPCGYANLAVTRLCDLGVQTSVNQLAQLMAPVLADRFDFFDRHNFLAEQVMAPLDE